MRPLCFDSDQQYSDWLDKADACPVPPRIDSGLPNFCFDCTWARKVSMTLAGRCAFPKTIFVRVHETKAGKLPASEEFVGVTVGAATLVSSPSADRNRQAARGLSPPKPAHQLQGAALTLIAVAPPDMEPTAPWGPEPSTERLP